MNQRDYLRMLDSGMDSADISKRLLDEDQAPSEAFNWKEAEHLETDFVTRPPMGIQVDANRFLDKSSQRIYGTPQYDQNGDMRCRCCGQVMSRAVSNSGEGIASCANIGCNAQGFAYAEGSSTHNPHRVRI
jgi:hypothetical protein